MGPSEARGVDPQAWTAAERSVLPGRPRLVIVRRGATELFYALQARYAGDPTRTAVIWDRRVSEDRRGVVREVPVERRRGERRFPVNSAAILNARGFVATQALRAPEAAGSPFSAARRG